MSVTLKPVVAIQEPAAGERNGPSASHAHPIEQGIKVRGLSKLAPYRGAGPDRRGAWSATLERCRAAGMDDAGIISGGVHVRLAAYVSLTQLGVDGETAGRISHAIVPLPVHAPGSTMH